MRGGQGETVVDVDRDVVSLPEVEGSGHVSDEIPGGPGWRFEPDWDGLGVGSLRARPGLARLRPRPQLRSVLPRGGAIVGRARRRGHGRARVADRRVQPRVRPRAPASPASSVARSCRHARVRDTCDLRADRRGAARFTRSPAAHARRTSTLTRGSRRLVACAARVSEPRPHHARDAVGPGSAHLRPDDRHPVVARSGRRWPRRCHRSTRRRPTVGEGSAGAVGRLRRDELPVIGEGPVVGPPRPSTSPSDSWRSGARRCSVGPPSASPPTGRSDAAVRPPRAPGWARSRSMFRPPSSVRCGSIACVVTGSVTRPSSPAGSPTGTRSLARSSSSNPRSFRSDAGLGTEPGS